MPRLSLHLHLFPEALPLLFRTLKWISDGAGGHRKLDRDAGWRVCKLVADGMLVLLPTGVAHLR